MAARLANLHAELAEAYAEGGAPSGRSSSTSARSSSGPAFHDLRYRLARLLLEAGRALEAREALEAVLAARPNFVDAEAALGLAHYLSGDAVAAPGTSGRDACSGGRRTRGSRRTSRCWVVPKRERAGRLLAAVPLVLAAGRPAGCSGADAERQADAGVRRRPVRRGAGGVPATSPGAAPDGRLWAKIAATALRAGELGEATDAYLHLAGEDPTRVREAAAGLEAVARAAERAGATGGAARGRGRPADDRARTGSRPLRAGARAAARRRARRAGAGCCPAAIAAAADQATVDSLLLRYGQALQSTAGCGQALLQYRAVLRRTQDSTLRARAKASAGECAFGLGQRALTAGRDDDAALWFAEAARADTASVLGRRALVGFGDVRLRQGDTLAAALAYQAAVPPRRRQAIRSPRWPRAAWRADRI